MNKTKDGRFIEDRVRVDIKLLDKIIRDIKQNYKFTWKELANKLSISPHSIREKWIKKGCTIPLSLFKQLIKLHPKLTFSKIRNEIDILDPYWGQRNVSHSNRKVGLPKLNSKKFAEFYGIMLGDGCIYSNLSGICISGHSILDKDYLENYVNNLILDLFKIKPKFYYSKKQKALRCILYSKKVVLFLKKIGFPIGKKLTQKVKIPQLFFNSKLLIKNCIKGMTDTDGSVYPHRKKSIIIDITINNNYLLNSYLKAFKRIGFGIKCTRNRLYLYGKDKSKEYFSRIGSSNTKHILKYENFVKKGFVPKSNDIENLLKEKYTLNNNGPVV